MKLRFHRLSLECTRFVPLEPILFPLHLCSVIDSHSLLLFQCCHVNSEDLFLFQMLFINEHRHVDGDIDDIISSDKISIAQDVCLFNCIVGIGHHIA